MDTDDDTTSVTSSERSSERSIERSSEEFEALSNPSSDHKLLTSQYSTLQDLEDDFHDFVAKAGFSIYTKRSSNKIKSLGYTRIDYGCAFDSLRPSIAHSRAPSTIKKNCTWEATAKALRVNNRQWTLEIREGCETHNHGATTGPKMRRKFTKEQKEFIKSYLDRPAIPNREIAESLRERFPSINFSRRQLKNTRHRQRKAQLHGLTPFQATMKLLDDANISYEVLWGNSEQTKPTGLFWSPQWAANEWKLYPWVQMYDNTYRTNNKGLALFQIVGINCFRMAFSCGFGLIDNERQEGFDWLMDQVNKRRIEIEAKPPGIVITDYDQAMKNAIARVYPEAKQQICIFHVNKNVVLHIKRKWDAQAAAAVASDFAAQTPASRPPQSAQPLPANDSRDEDIDPDDQRVVQRLNNLASDRGNPATLGPLPDQVEYSKAGLYKLWEHVLYAATVEDFQQAYEKLKAFFWNQTAILDYLEETYMTVCTEWATCYVNKRLNFSHRTTSPVEILNRYIKSFMVTGNSTVLHVVKQSFRMVEAMERNIAEVRKQQQERVLMEYVGKEWLREAPYNVAHMALKKITEQYRIMLGAIPTRKRPNPPPLDDCTSQFTAQFSIPCSHELLRRHEANELRLRKEDFHPYWWLERSLVDENQYLRYQEFDRTENLRGRPRNTDVFAPQPTAPRSTAPLSTMRESGLAPSIRRHPSQWEGIRLTSDGEEPQTTTSQQDDVVIASTAPPASQPPGRGRGGRGGRGSRSRAGRRGGTTRADSVVPSTPQESGSVGGSAVSTASRGRGAVRKRVGTRGRGRGRGRGGRGSNALAAAATTLGHDTAETG